MTVALTAIVRLDAFVALRLFEFTAVDGPGADIDDEDPDVPGADVWPPASTGPVPDGPPDAPLEPDDEPDVPDESDDDGPVEPVPPAPGEGPELPEIPELPEVPEPPSKLDGREPASDPRVVMMFMGRF